MAEPVASQGESRELFLSRVRSALGRTGDAPDVAPPAVDQSLIRLTSDGVDLAEHFAARAKEMGAAVHRCKQAESSDLLGKLLKELAAKNAVVGFNPSFKTVDVAEVLKNLGIQTIEWRDAGDFGPTWEVDVGITDVHTAIAETGTLVCNADADHSRALSLTPPVHIALVRRSDIIADMVDYWPRFAGMTDRALPSSQVFITGPSKTADIEGQLITGVHGPGKVHIILIDDA